MLSYEVALLLVGILLLLVGLVGKVKAKELEVGTSSTIARIATGLAGVALIVPSVFFKDLGETFTSSDPNHSDSARVPLPATPIPRIQLKGGTYTIQQKSNGRFVDAHEGPGNDFALVTRTAQNNNTQRWVFKFMSLPAR